MNFSLISRHLGAISILIALGMVVCLPFGFEQSWIPSQGERAGLFGLLGAIAVAAGVGVTLREIGRRIKSREEQLFQREAIAIVVFGWLLVFTLGALPYLFSGVTREQGIKMDVFDALFESVSGFTTTGGTVLSELEDVESIARCVLFWRSMTNFYGGIGVLVLLVALGAQKTSRKNAVNTEMSSIIAERPPGQIRKITGNIFTIYVSLIGILALILWFLGLPLHDSLCHAFGSVATGGFSTYNASVGHFAANTDLNAPLIEGCIALFCLLGASNFMLFYWFSLRKPGILFRNEEWRWFLTIYVVASILVLATGLYYDDFDVIGTSDNPVVRSVGEENESETASSNNSNHDAQTAIDAKPAKAPLFNAVRYVFFNVASVLTTTGFCTDDFSRWNDTSRFVIFLLMFIGGCAGSTAGSIKVIRFVVIAKVMTTAATQTYRPSIVSKVFANGTRWTSGQQKRVLLYFATFLMFFALTTAVILTIEPTSKWEHRKLDPQSKALDVSSCVASCYGGVGPGYGIAGPRSNFGCFSGLSKLLFCWAMFLGRLEIFIVLAVLCPNFWDSSGLSSSRWLGGVEEEDEIE